MKKMTLLFGLLVGALMMVSCNKEDDSKPETKRDQLVNKTCWKISKFEVDFNGTYQDVTFLFFDDCNLDNCFNFKSDGKLDVTEGASKCDAGDPDLYDSGTWSLSDDFKTFNVAMEDLELKDAQVLTLDATTFIVEGEDDLSKVRVTFK